MATVEIRFSALHTRADCALGRGHRRPAARVDEQLLDEVRLAVGEACSRAVGCTGGVG
jgi:hypothetical protein